MIDEGFEMNLMYVITFIIAFGCMNISLFFGNYERHSKTGENPNISMELQECDDRIALYREGELSSNKIIQQKHRHILLLESRIDSLVKIINTIEIIKHRFKNKPNELEY